MDNFALQQIISRIPLLKFRYLGSFPSDHVPTLDNDTFACKWTIYNGRRKVCINFQTDTDKVNIVVYRYRNITYLKDTEMDIKLTEYKKVLANRVYLLSYIDIFYKRCIVLDETTVHN